MTAKYRFLFVRAFALTHESEYRTWEMDGPKENLLMNYENLDLGRLLGDVEWDFHPGPPATYGNWPVENREEFALVAADRLAVIKQACESGKYNAIVLLGGGEPGAMACREIGKRYGIPVTSNATAQFHIAGMVGHKFSVIDMAESHSMHYYDIVVGQHMAQRCASIRNIPYPLGRPPYTDGARLAKEKTKALAGEPNQGVTDAVDAAEAAIEEDGADTIIFGCSATYWLQPFVRKGLADRGWDVPVLEGYSCAIAQAKLMVDLGLDASGLLFPPDRPGRTRRKIVF
jgi:allantoin racemase